MTHTLSTIDGSTAMCNPRSAEPGSASAAHLLTVNVEDYYQAAVFHRFIQARNWYRFDSRLQQNVEETLNVLAQTSTTATFFILGWIAEQHPQLIRQISDAGHEIASRGFLHQPLLQLSRRDRMDDLLRSRLLLEDVTGKPVHGFRLSDGWLRQTDLSFLEEISEAGYIYDSSLMPRRRDFRQQPQRRTIHQHKLVHGSIVEIPPSTMPFACGWMPIAGGNYQRQLPDSLMRSAVQRWTQTETAPYVMYFQIWEMDSEQPEMSVVGRLSRIRHYRNLGKYRWLLPEYLQRWKFVSVSDHAQRIDSPLKSISRMIRDSAAADSGVTPLTALPSAAFVSKQCTTPQSGPYPALSTVVRAGLADEIHRNGDAASLSPGRRAAEPTAAPAGSGRSCADSGTAYYPQRQVRTAVTLVIPCFNEESSLPYLSRTLTHLKAALSADYDLSVLFVDDCSRDQTRELLHTLFDREADVRIVYHDQNRGVSAAILTGLAAAKTEIVCSIDCDCSYDPHELQQMLPLMTSDVAMVTASPYHRDGSVRNVPRWRLTLSHGLSILYRVLLRQQLATWTSCFRVYRKSCIVDLPLRESGFLGTAELAAELSLHRRIIVEHPAVLEVRLFGLSKMKTVRTILSHLRLLARVAGKRFRLSTASGDARSV